MKYIHRHVVCSVSICYYIYYEKKGICEAPEVDSDILGNLTEVVHRVSSLGLAR